MTEGRRWGNWETKSKRKRNDEEWNIDWRNDSRKKAKETERRKVREKGMMRNEILI